MRKVLCLFCVFLCVMCGCGKQQNENPEMNICGFECSEADMSEYSSLEGSNHVFLDANYEEALEMLKKEAFSGVLYFGYPSCPWCEEAIPLMNEAAKSSNLDIYYVNKKSDFNIKHPELEEEIVKILDAAYGLEKNKDGNPHLYVPEVVVIKNGKILQHHLGTFDAHDATERKMTENERIQLKDIYLKMFKEIGSSK